MGLLDFMHIMQYFSVLYTFRIIFWITGKDIVAGKLNGLAERLCYSAESEPLALTLDVEGQYLYWMSLNNDDNTVWLNQLNYTAEECGARLMTHSDDTVMITFFVFL